MGTRPLPCGGQYPAGKGGPPLAPAEHLRSRIASGDWLRKAATPRLTGGVARSSGVTMKTARA
jgi:hypothetical protein